MRVIAGDVGGTKTLLRCVEERGETSAEMRYDSASFVLFEDLVADFLSRCPGPVDHACFAVAGPVLGDHATVTNVGWELSCAELQQRHRFASVRLINDFYAVALGVPLLGDDDTVTLQHGERDRNAPIGILGAGTGLGEAILIPHAGEFVVVPTEGGHQSFAPQDEEQIRILRHLQKKYGHVSWERVVSGMGLENIYESFTGEVRDPAEIALEANRGVEPARRTFEIFVDAYGAEAGNMGLRVLARGGVFLAGGIAAKNIHWFTDGRFIEAFRRKGRFEELMATIPVYLITNEQVGLIGAVSMAMRQAVAGR